MKLTYSKLTIILFLAIIVLVSGCRAIINRKNIELNPFPKIRGALKNKQKFSSDKIINFGLDGVYQKSIGDILLDVIEGRSGESEIVVYRDIPACLVGISKYSVWESKYLFRIEDQLNPVYVSQNYYKGSVGVMVEKNGTLSAKTPFIQVRGGHIGRVFRHRSDAVGKPFFGRDWESKNHWCLRFGGTTSIGSHIFEICKYEDQTVSDIIQRIEITPENAQKGFIVRGVKIIIQEALPNGLITYRAEKVQ